MRSQKISGASTQSVETLKKALSSLGLQSPNQARAEALEKIGPVLMTALDEFHTHLEETDKKVTELSSMFAERQERIITEMNKMSEQFASASSWIIKMLDAFHKQEPEKKL